MLRRKVLAVRTVQVSFQIWTPSRRRKLATVKLVAFRSEGQLQGREERTKTRQKIKRGEEVAGKTARGRERQ